MTSKKKLPFIKHLDELRRRVFYSVLVIIICSGIGYYFHSQLLIALISPLGQPVYYTTPGGGFDLVFKVSVVTGILLAMPYLVFQIIQFIKPAVSEITKKATLLLIISSWILLAMGILTAYFVSLPAALYFLNSFGTADIKSLISSKDYLSFVILYLGGFGFIFQLPLFILFINSLVKLSVRNLISYYRFVFLGSFIIAAVLTPTPDLFNQLFMALPIIILYGFSIILIWIINIKNLNKTLHSARIK